MLTMSSTQNRQTLASFNTAMVNTFSITHLMVKFGCKQHVSIFCAKFETDCLAFALQVHQ